MHCNALLAILSLLFLGLTSAAPTPNEALKLREDSNTKLVSVIQSLTAATTTNTVAPTHTAPSTCTTYYPTVLRQLLEAVPDVMQENTAGTTKAFHVAQSVSMSDGIKYNRIQQYVVFSDIKPSSWDCQLMVSWPDVSRVNISVGVSSHEGSSATSSVSLDVYAASYNASAYASMTRPEGAKIGTPNDGPFATWASMMGALKVGGNQLSVKGDREQGRDRGNGAVNAKLTYFSTVAVNPGEYGITINSEACPPSTSNTLEFLFEIPGTDSRDASVSFLAEKEKGAGVYLLADC